MNAPLWEQIQFNKARQKYAYYDEQLRDIGGRVQEPDYGGSLRGYQRKALSTLQNTLIPQNNQLSQIDLHKLDGAAIDALEGQIIKACHDYKNDPTTVPPGTFRQHTSVDSDTGHKAFTFVGPWTGRTYPAPERDERGNPKFDENGYPKLVEKREQASFIKDMNRLGRHVWCWNFPAGSTNDAGRPVPSGYRYPDGRPMPVAQTLLGAGYLKAA